MQQLYSEKDNNGMYDHKKKQRKINPPQQKVNNKVENEQMPFFVFMKSLLPIKPEGEVANKSIRQLGEKALGLEVATSPKTSDSEEEEVIINQEGTYTPKKKMKTRRSEPSMIKNIKQTRDNKWADIFMKT